MGLRDEKAPVVFSSPQLGYPPNHHIRLFTNSLAGDDPYVGHMVRWSTGSHL